MAGESTQRVPSPIDDALGRLPEQARAQVLAALEVSGSFRFSWRDRYEAADLAMRALGASRLPKGRRRRETLYQFPCGCSVKLDYARPWLLVRCSEHPLASLDRPGFAEAVAGVARGIGVVAIVATVIASGVATLVSVAMLLSGELESKQLRVLAWYWLIFGVAAAWWVWQRHVSQQKAK